MGNMFDYLDWRGDVPFSADPFGEADNLLLCELAYIDFDGIVPGPGENKRISIDEVCTRFWESHTEEQERGRATFYRMAPFLLKKMKGAERYEGTELGRYVNLISTEKDEQISAVTFYLPDGTIYAAFRGTDNTIVGWKEDFCLSFMEETSGQRQAVKYLDGLSRELLYTKNGHRRKIKKEPPRVRVGGHSKGGNFAVFAAAFCGEETKELIMEVYTNDGPGFLESVTQTPEYQSILPKIRSYIPEQSVFGLLLHAGYEHHVIRSSERGLFQHDPLSWQILRNRLVAAPERAEGSILTEKTLDGWINGIPLEDRRVFVDSLFDLIAGSGAETLGELRMDPVSGIREGLRSYRVMDSEEQRLFRDTVLSLIKSGTDALAQQMQGAFRKRVQRILEVKDEKAEEVKAEEAPEPAQEEEQGSLPQADPGDEEQQQ